MTKSSLFFVFFAAESDRAAASAIIPARSSEQQADLRRHHPQVLTLEASGVARARQASRPTAFSCK